MKHLGRYLAIFLVFPLLLYSAFAFPEQAGGTPLLSLPERLVDFGKAVQGEKALGEFTLRNSGSAVLHINEIRPSCGCTVAKIETREIPPGGSALVQVEIDTSGKVGKIKKNVLIKSDDPLTPEAGVELLVEVQIKDHVNRGSDQTLFKGACAECHAVPAAGQTGEALFEAVCAQCHGHYGLRGGAITRLNSLDYLKSHDDADIGKAIAEGKQNTSMPGFSAQFGGPLDEAQINSLVGLIRWWEEGFVFKDNEKRHGHLIKSYP